jgi:hypothetical protein
LSHNWSRICLDVIRVCFYCILRHLFSIHFLLPLLRLCKSMPLHEARIVFLSGHVSHLYPVTIVLWVSLVFTFHVFSCPTLSVLRLHIWFALLSLLNKRPTRTSSQSSLSLRTWIEAFKYPSWIAIDFTIACLSFFVEFFLPLFSLLLKSPSTDSPPA